MSTIAQELDECLRTLDPRRAARCEQLVRDVLALLAEEPELQPRREFITRTHDSGLMPGIDPTKLGQMSEEL
jgi:plasmid stabilization system protein ParE